MATEEVEPVSVNPITAWLEGKVRNKVVVTLVQDTELAERMAAAESTRMFAIMQAQANPEDAEKAQAVIDVKEIIEALEREAESASLKLTFVGLPADDFDRLERAHPPTREQVREARKRATDIGAPPEIPQLNQDTFGPALIQAACFEPEMDLETATALYRSPNLNAGELSKILNAAHRAQLDPASRFGQ